MSAIHDVVALAQQCLAALQHIKPQGGSFRSPSAATRLDYLRVAKGLLSRAGKAKGRLTEVVQGTSSKNYYFKCLAALRFHCYVQLDQLMTMSQQANKEADYLNLRSDLTDLLAQMEAVAAIQHQGHITQRIKRKSKRLALKGLPPGWREALCDSARRSKYAQALMVMALTGCRPAELKLGVKVWTEHDKQLGKDLICFLVTGCKVKGKQGQPTRRICYDAHDPHPLVVAMKAQLDAQAAPVTQVSIANANNFTVEIRRRAARLWPSHKHTITAYCFRHQWSADTKHLGDGDAVSRGLGHASAKTRRHYGMAGQASSPCHLQPIKIEADRTVRSAATPTYPSPDHEP